MVILPLSNSLMRNTSHNKYHIHAKAHNIELQKDYSMYLEQQPVDWQLLKGHLESSGTLNLNKDIVIKVVPNNDEANNEISVHSRMFQNGFMRLLCNFQCQNRDTDNYSTIMVMPYYPLGSLCDFCLSEDNIHVLRSLLKQAILHYLAAYDAHGFVHKNLYARNVLVSDTQDETVTRTLSDGNTVTIPTFGKSATIMEFDSSEFTQKTPHDDLSQFYWDIGCLITMLPHYIENICKWNVSFLTVFILELAIGKESYTSFYPLFNLIDKHICTLV